MADTKNQNFSEEGSSDWRPGAKLKQLREEANIALDVIAKETLIPFSKLQFLEEDEYAKVGKEVFTIAYIRKYAKSLGVASDPLVEQFKFITGFKSSSDSCGTAAEMTGIHQNATFSLLDKIKGWQIIVLIIAIWLISVFVLDSEKVEIDESVNESEVQVEETSELLPQAAEEVSHLEPVETTDSIGSVDEQEYDGSETSAVEAESGIAKSSSTSSGTGKDLLVMSFFAECWVKVWDAKGEVIFAQLQNSGDNLRLSGEAPFSVMLGNAKAVDLLVNGRRVATEPPEGQRTKRLSVGP